MRRVVAAAVLAVAACFIIPSAGHGQTWPDTRSAHSGIQWIVGGHLSTVGLGSFGEYEISLDPWPVLGVSLRPGDFEDRLRTRFEILAAPGVAMRRSPIRPGGVGCVECTPESLRLTVLSTRFLFDLTFPVGGESRGYLTAGPTVRVQLSDTDLCSADAAGDCALPQFGRSRLDPGLMVGVGWERPEGWIRSLQLGTRMSAYGRGEHPDASPRTLLPELDFTVRFSFDP